MIVVSQFYCSRKVRIKRLLPVLSVYVIINVSNY